MPFLLVLALVFDCSTSKLFVFLALILALTGCSLACTPSPTPPVPVPHVTDTACDWIPRLSVSTHDTEETKREVEAYELARQTKCRKNSGTPIAISGG